MNTGAPAAIVLGFLLTPASAVTMLGVTVENRVISFDSAAPGTLLSNVAVTGLTEVEEVVQGLDVRPGTGQVYLFGGTESGNYRVYTLNPFTGVATRVGTADIPMQGTQWGFDFNPVADVIRVVGVNGASLRVSPVTGAMVAPDTNVTPLGVAAVAYDRNDTNAATATTLFGINVTTDHLVRIGGVDGSPSPNGGQANIVGLLGINTTLASLDIYGVNQAFAALSTAGAGDATSFYTVNLTTGAATLVGGIGDGTLSVKGLTAVPEVGGGILMGVAGVMLLGRRRGRGRGNEKCRMQNEE